MTIALFTPTPILNMVFTHKRNRGCFVLFGFFLLLTGVVLKALAHLLPVRREDETVHDQVLVGGFVEQRCPQDGEGVEPSSRLRDKAKKQKSKTKQKKTKKIGANTKIPTT